MTATSEVRVTASQQDIAVEQLHEEEHQRVLGVIPNFYVTYVPNAPPLTTQAKVRFGLEIIRSTRYMAGDGRRCGN